MLHFGEHSQRRYEKQVLPRPGHFADHRERAAGEELISNGNEIERKKYAAHFANEKDSSRKDNAGNSQVVQIVRSVKVLLEKQLLYFVR